MKRLIASIAFLAVALGAAAHHTGGAHKTLVSKDRSGVALQGYDPVAHFTDNKPVRGNAKPGRPRHPGRRNSGLRS